MRRCVFLFFSAFRSLYFRELTIFIKRRVEEEKKVSLFIIPKGIKIVNWLYLNILLFLFPLSPLPSLAVLFLFLPHT